MRSMPLPMFFTISAEAMINPSCGPEACCKAPLQTFHPTMDANNFAKAAAKNACDNGPHHDVQSCESTPNNNEGSVKNCKDLAATNPPGFIFPAFANANAIATAVAGGSNNFPILVVFPVSYAVDAAPAMATPFPQVSVDPMNGN
mmetsp:Transcript_26518/g.37244  ORF Transcript_26518/g.37244 Transcript_26518/m.37244 type:complete len:145 (+) Transcript_26518:1290-1724(+)